MNQRLVFALVAGAVFVCFASAAYGADIHVPGDHTSIQAAIDAATAGDTVIVADGTYNETNTSFHGKAITVRSANGAQNCIIDCQSVSRGFLFDSGETTNSVLDGFTIRNGSVGAIEGGGITCLSSSPMITNCILSSNTARIGGGIYCNNSSPEIINCTIENNTATETDNGGGGIMCWSNSSPTVRNCILRGNQGRWGAAIMLDTNCYPQIVNCLLANNNSTYNGGGIMVGSSTATLINCTIVNNTAVRNGGGMYCFNGVATLQNCIIWGNTAGNDGNQFFTFQSGGSSSITLNYCDYSNGAGDISGIGTFSPDANCITDDPLLVGSGDYHPQDTSPCIDAGNDFYVSGVSEDIEGNTRIMGAAVDMGAYEINADSPIVSVTTPASPSGSPVTITYDVSDPQDDTVTVSFDYSVDGGTTWASATAASGDSNPQTGVTTPANGLTFMWDASADLASQIEDAMVRVTADDGNGHTGEDTTDEFTVIDLQPPSNFTGVGYAIDQIEWSWIDAVGPNAYLLEDTSSNRVAIVAPGQESYIETVSGENTPATRLLRSSVSSTTQLTVEPTGTATGASLPWYTTGYHAQFLYTAVELSNTEGSIKKIYWQRSTAGPGATYTDVSVTLGHSTKTALEGNCSGNFDVDGSELVRDAASYNPPAASTDSEWIEIPLDRSFYYDGTNNLVLDIDVASGTDSIAWSKVDTTTGVYTSLYGTSGGSSGNPWQKKFFLQLDVETIDAVSGPATASAFTLVHDAATDDFTVELGVTGQEVEITITAPPNPSAGLTGVKIERATNDTFTLNATTIQDFTDNYSFTDTDVTGGDTYYYRITFSNGDGIASAESAGESITVLGPNCPPVATITAPTSGSHTGDIDITYDLRDYDGDTTQIIAEYSTDGGSTWITATMGSGGDGTTPLSTSLAGDAHTYAWDSLADGVGTSVAEPAQLRITPTDKDGTGTEDTTSFMVSNIDQEPPVVTITSPTTGAVENGDITIAYTLEDVNADNCDLTVEYSRDGGVSWNPCFPGAGGDGVTGLASSASGVTHTFVWASETDMPNDFADITLRVIADDGHSATTGGTGSDTVDFSVDNGAAITAHLSGTPVAGNAPLTVQFADLSVGYITSWLWTFGDGATSTEQNPSHQYTIAGSFNVSLTVTGPSGPDTETRDSYVSVVAPPAAPKKKSGGGCCRIDGGPTPPNELMGYFMPVLLIACAYLALRRRTTPA